MGEEDKETKQPEEQQTTKEPTEEPTEEPTTDEVKDEGPNPEKGDGKGSKSTSSYRDDAPFLGSYGNAAGNKVESVLSPVGRPVGKGLETVTKPVGGIVDALVGGVLRSGAAYGDVAGVGAGNLDKKKAEERAERHADVGGKEQTGENPLGL